MSDRKVYKLIYDIADSKTRVGIRKCVADLVKIPIGSRVLKVIYNPKYYGITKLNKKSVEKEQVSLEKIISIFENSKSFVEVKQFIDNNEFTYQQLKLLYFIINKGIPKLGPRVVEKFVASDIIVPYQKILKGIENYRGTFPAFLQEKRNGMFAYVFQDGTALSRGGHKKLFPSLIPELKVFSEKAGQPIVLVGELEIIGLTRAESVGKIHSFFSESNNPHQEPNILYTVWDYVPESQFYKKSVPQLGLKQKLDYLREIFSANKFNHIEMIKTSTVFDKEDAIKTAKELVVSGAEGGVLKDVNYMWGGNEPRLQVAIKFKKSADVRLVGYLFGKKDTVFEGKIGSLIVESEDKVIRSRVSSGLSLEERADIEKWEQLIKERAVVEIEYEGVTKNYALEFGSFVTVRTDKSVADDFSTICKL